MHIGALILGGTAALVASIWLAGGLCCSLMMMALSGISPRVAFGLFSQSTAFFE